MNIPNQTGQLTGNNMMETIKQQLMTMTMMNSMNGNNNNSGKDNGMINMIYIFFATAIIDFICKSVLPNAISEFKKFYRSNIKNTLLKEITSKTAIIKSASITIHINISDHENKIGQALLDFITNNINTKHVTFNKQNFILNQTDVIEIGDELFVSLTEITETDESSSNGVGIKQTIELFSYKKTMNELRLFLNKISHNYEIKIKNKLGDDIFYFNQVPMNAPKTLEGGKDYTKLPNNSIFTMKKFQTNRQFTNLFGPEITAVKNRVEFFIKNRKWYDLKGIPYTLGLLLSGQAGAGKTSTIKCLANETTRHIININLNNDITKVQMENLFYNEEISVINVSTGQTQKYCIPLDQRIYVLEDIDCQGDLVMERGLKKPNELIVDDPLHLDLSFLLNLLDGVLEIPGRIVIMTSNHIKMLDHALIRPGRIDVIADFKKCLNQTLIEMIEFFYDIKTNNEDRIRINSLNEEILSPAEMGKLMFEHIDNYLNVIEKLEQNPILNSSYITDNPNREAEETNFTSHNDTFIETAPVFSNPNEPSTTKIQDTNPNEPSTTKIQDTNPNEPSTTKIQDSGLNHYRKINSGLNNYDGKNNSSLNDYRKINSGLNPYEPSTTKIQDTNPYEPSTTKLQDKNLYEPSMTKLQDTNLNNSNLNDYSETLKIKAIWV